MQVHFYTVSGTVKNSPLPIMSTYHIHEIEKITTTKYVDITQTQD